MMDLETLRQQAEARWPLGWEIAEDVLAANPGPLTIVLDYADDPPTLSCYNQAQPLIDGDPFRDLDAALQDAAAAWQRLVAHVPPLAPPADAALVGEDADGDRL